MTLKAKPVVKRAQRPGWEGQERRNFLLNIAFGVVVIAAVGILVIAGAWTWYDQHLASVGSVDGQNITKDELRDRFEIESWRVNEAERRIRTAVVAGELTEAEGQSQLESLGNTRNQLPSIALERVIDSKLQATLAVAEGISVTPEEIDAQLVEEATTPEQRLAWVIELAPEVDAGAVSPTAEQRAAARTAADVALKQLEDGAAWEDVATTVSTDTSTASQAGDLGWLQADDPQMDETYVEAIFAAQVDSPTAVIEGEDGIFRIGRVTQVVAETIDGAYQAKLTNDGIDLAKYRLVVQADVIHTKLEDKVVAEVSRPGPQRQVQQIFIAEADPTLGEDAIKVRHILYSPNDDPSGAAALDPADPGWVTAVDEAGAAYEMLQADPDLFDSMARAESDELGALGPTGTGGKLPYFDSASQIDEAFKAAIVVPGLEPDQILQPVKSSFGWHVIQVLYFPPDIDQMNALKARAAGGDDFALLATDHSEDQSSGAGGDIGWIARGQLDSSLIDAIFATQVGETSSVVTAEGEGLYLFKVLAEEVRTPDGRQLEDLRATAFSDWYTARKDAALIDRGDGTSGVSVG